MALIRNITADDIAMEFRGKTYTFPACPVVEDKEGEKKEPVKVVEVGNPDIADWFVNKAYLSPNTKKQLPLGLHRLVLFNPEKIERVRVVEQHFPIQLKKADPPPLGTALNSFHTRRPDDAPAPKPDPEKLERQRREMIATLPAGLLRNEVERRKLADKKTKLDRQAMVDMLVATDFVPPAV